MPSHSIAARTSSPLMASAAEFSAIRRICSPPKVVSIVTSKRVSNCRSARKMLVVVLLKQFKFF